MEIFAAVEALSALAHETRLEIFRLLVRTGPSGLAVGQISEHVKIPPATMSFHLSHLQKAGLLTSKRESRQIIYTANYQTMGTLMAFLTENCCQKDTQTQMEANCCMELPPSC